MTDREEPIRLSYCTSTLNKLPYLKITLERLITKRQPDEEILVADGGSTDGTREYLEALLGQGKIQYFVSEKDAGESHALNKLFLKARGELLTLVTDDDAFHYPTIQACKKFMLEHPDVDLIGTDGGKKNQNPDDSPRSLLYVSDYKRWQETHRPFSFCGLGIMMRRKSLTLLGLWHTDFSRADAEFTLRVTAGKGNVAWYSGPSFVNISNPQSVSITKMKKIYYETQKLEQFYYNKPIVIPKFIVELRSKLGQWRRRNIPLKKLSIEEWEKMFKDCEAWLEKQNRQTPGTFLFKS